MGRKSLLGLLKFILLLAQGPQHLHGVCFSRELFHTFLPAVRRDNWTWRLRAEVEHKLKIMAGSILQEINIHTYERRRKGLYSNSSISVDGTVGLSSSSLACRRNNRQATQPKTLFLICMCSKSGTAHILHFCLLATSHIKTQWRKTSSSVTLSPTLFFQKVLRK